MSAIPAGGQAVPPSPGGRGTEGEAIPLDPNRIVCIDLDGTLIEHYDEPYDDAAPLKPVMPGAGDFVTHLVEEGFTVVCLTARPPETHGRIQAHLFSGGVFIHIVTNVKPPAVAYIDDRAIGFWGDWPGSADSLLSRIAELSPSRGTGVSPVHDHASARSPRAAEGEAPLSTPRRAPGASPSPQPTVGGAERDVPAASSRSARRTRPASPRASAPTPSSSIRGSAKR